jgi:hypothetical protein
MAKGRGFDSVVARKKAATWGTAVSLNEANRKLPALSYTVDDAVNQLDNDELTGKASRLPSDRGAITVTGSAEMHLRYDGLDLDIAMIMGRATTPTKRGATPPSYYNSYSIRDSLEGYFATFAADKQVAVHEVDSAKYNQMTISGDAGDRLMLSFDIIGRLVTISGTNTDLSSVTEKLPRKYVMFEDCKFLANAASGAALVPGVDDFYPSSFTVTINNNLAGDLTSENDPYVDEPLRNNFIEVTGTFTIPKYGDTTFEQAKRNLTPQKLWIRAVSSTQIVAAGQGPYYYEFNMFFPNVEITEAPRDIAGVGNIAGTFSFKATQATTAPSGMDGSGNSSDTSQSRGSITDAVEIEVRNVNNANPLA